MPLDIFSGGRSMLLIRNYSSFSNFIPVVYTVIYINFNNLQGLNGTNMKTLVKFMLR